jgi:hypothetical protein
MDKHLILSVFHILFVVPLFLYVGFIRASTPEWLYTTFLVLGLILFLYHGYRFITRYLSRSPYAWVNAIHVALVAPLLLYIGYHKKNTPRFAYELLLLLGFGAGGYHVFSLVKMVNMHPETI